MTEDLLLFDSLDACLGPHESRFFGAGYKRVGQYLRHIVADGSTAPGAQVNAWASLTYPRDWSRKSSARELRPHVSSIDVLVLAASLAEVHLNTGHGLTPEQQRRTWLRSVDIRASNRPHEDLTDFPVRARLLESGSEGEGTGLLRSTYDCRVGGLKARCAFVHEPGARTAAGGGDPVCHVFDSVADALGPAQVRVYGEGYKTHRQTARHVAVDLAGQRVRARQQLALHPADQDERAGRGGLGARLGAEAAYAPSVSMVDALVSIAQLAQALLYAQDDLARGRSDTLWMRRMVIEADTPTRPADEPFDAAAYTTKNRLISLDGELWRATDLKVDDFCGIHGWCSIAHRLPARRAA
ncbi:AvrD family protein [Streptomyces sp. XD-27]|uniref:AvrD family protein n=1 Tax=Streptomyces sp. XD-27 TaxID=3062779 RepID=UPI0026F421D4|nr:AvrD family protein [Streptomyces sp. XD-27]WKX70282.1 AvrD family protein [Streptomyces sp. XD-27]